MKIPEYMFNRSFNEDAYFMMKNYPKQSDHYVNSLSEAELVLKLVEWPNIIKILSHKNRTPAVLMSYHRTLTFLEDVGLRVTKELITVDYDREFYRNFWLTKVGPPIGLMYECEFEVKMGRIKELVRPLYYNKLYFYNRGTLAFAAGIMGVRKGTDVKVNEWMSYTIANQPILMLWLKGSHVSMLFECFELPNLKGIDAVWSDITIKYQ